MFRFKRYAVTAFGLLAVATPFVHAECTQAVSPSLTLVQALERLQQCNRDIQLARGAVDAARADVLTADRRPNPTLTVGGATINPQTGIGGGSLAHKQVDWQARLDQTAERGDKRAWRTAVAEGTLDASRWGVAEMQRQQQWGFANAWIDLWAAQQRVQALAALQNLYQRTQDAAQVRLRAGDIASGDVLRISVDAQRAQSDLALAATEHARARFQLAALLGMEAQATALVARDAWPTSAVAPGAPSADSDAIDRPDVQVARAQLAAAKAARELALSLRKRDLNVGVQLDHYPAPAGTGNTVSVAVSMPLFVHHEYDGEIARAEADYTSALLAVRKAEQQARADQKRLATDWQAAARRAATLNETLLPMVEKIAAHADLAYKKGASGVFELLDALKQLRQMQLDAVQATADFQKADAASRAAALRADPAIDLAFWSAPAPTAPPTPNHR